jgi:hypothetical protein
MSIVTDDDYPRAFDMAQSDAVPTNCPQCGKLLEIVKSEYGDRSIYICFDHGRFWLDDDGRLREERRSPDRPKTI